ncbi:hypothetical protein L6164_031530 [Bauhinia variegata]|uniref:Uncharacterized protein n=1 Tax=Bauhinia variegata TaxID=167791 RepID=A0ACB9LG60_BAUVA|nr:hypothetical protein L6164_031530 [Bauhinia variegata]
MGRGRLVIEPLNNEKARNASFVKRKTGLIKKAYELSTLCGVDLCLLIYGPEPNAQPETWPLDPALVHRIIEKYHDKISERRPKHYDVQDFYKDRLNKVEAEIMKTRKDYLKLLYPTWDERFNMLDEATLRNFISYLDSKIDACNQRISMQKRHRYITEKREQLAIIPPPCLDSNRSHLNLIAHNMMVKAQFSPLPMNPLVLHQNQLGEISFSKPQFDKNLMQLMDMNNGIVGIGAINFDPRTAAVVEGEVKNNQNSQAGLENFSSLPPGFQMEDNHPMLQAQMFNHMNKGNGPKI